MYKHILTIVLSLVALTPVTHASDWTKIVADAGKSVMYLESSNGSCTGFSIDEARDFVLTAAHCQGLGLVADGTPAEEVWKDRKKDLMVLKVKGHGKPAMVFADKDPVIGQEIMSIGYGHGLERPMYRTAHVSDNKAFISIESEVLGPFISTDIMFVQGQSGGPVVDLTGKIVMIVQRTSSSVGLGVGTELIRDKIGRFLGKEKK